jgi:hypothetical protein
MKQAIPAILAPAAAIILAALIQQLLITAFPILQSPSLGKVSIDSHLEVVVMLGLSFCAAYLIKRRAASRGVLMASLLFPTAFLILILASQPLALSLQVSPDMNWLRINLLLSAIAPLLGTVLAYVVPSNNRLERARGASSLDKG